MLEKGSSKSKTGIYKTMDGRCREAKPSPAAGSDTVALLSSLKTQSKAPKSGPSYNSRTHAGNETKQNRRPGEANGQPWHLSTFSSPEQLASFKEKHDQLLHDTMLRKELAKFRAEVEDKFLHSAANQQYEFPRIVALDQDELGEELSGKPLSRADCTIPSPL